MLHLLPQFLIAAGVGYEAANHLVPLVFHKLMTPGCHLAFLLKVGQLHAGRLYLKLCHRLFLRFGQVLIQIFVPYALKLGAGQYGEQLPAQIQSFLYGAVGIEAL